MDERRMLNDLKVLDFTRVVAGPAATRMLSDLGASIIKIDQIPTSLKTPVRSAGGVANNVGKRSIAIDLKTEEGIEIVKAIAREVDVVVENFLPGVMKSLGLDYGSLKEINPGMIYASISGFGQTGSQSYRRAYGSTAHAEAGWLWVQQHMANTSEPFAPGVTLADILTAMNTVSGILVALYHRERTGIGQWLDVTLMESQFSLMSEAARDFLNVEEKTDWKPSGHPVHTAVNGYVTINLGGAQDFRGWGRISKALRHEGELMPSTVEEANELVGSWVSKMKVEEIAKGMESTGAAYGIVKSIQEAVGNTYFTERGMIVDLPDSLDGTTRVIGSPLHFSDTLSGPHQGGAPLAGENSRELLRAFGYSDGAINNLLRSSVIAEQTPPGPDNFLRV